MADDQRTPPARDVRNGEEEEEVESSAPTSDVLDSSSNGKPRPPALRGQTAPAIKSRPSGRTFPSSYLLPGRNPDTGNHGTFQYHFDMAHSDWDSSSSDDESSEQTDARRTRSGVSEPDSEERRRFLINNEFFRTKGRVSRRDGRLKISMEETAQSGVVSKALGRSIRKQLGLESGRTSNKRERKRETASKPSLHSSTPEPKMNIVVMVIGSRGDIQPFLKIGKILKEQHGHRVRIATHPVFEDFVEATGLEFFGIGGDPSELMAFMVKNPGLIPNVSTIRGGDIGRRRADMGTMFEGFWKACVTSGRPPKGADGKESPVLPFVADAIIANPPSMAHVHIAERLGIPLHIVFTFPYTPTTQFPHPLANIKYRKSNVDTGYVNLMSYPLVEMMTWQGLGDIVNRFREHTLHLEPVSSLWAPGALYRAKVPYTYIWSPSLVPKPQDWGKEIDIAGFVFLDLAHDYKPPDDLQEFLDAGEPPVYIGFGSIVVDDPDEFTEMILKAVELAGVRALISKGWGGFGATNANTPKNVFMLGNIPHDWLFPRTRAVVHHGGAGTTAIGLKCARPTMIVPFFGDQPFWGNMVAGARAGAFECIPYKKLTVETLAEGIKQCLTEEAQQNVQKIADSISAEGDGAENAVKSFMSQLPLTGRHSMRCSILQDRVAVWKVKKSSLRLSAMAAELLLQQGEVKRNELKLIRHRAWNDFDGPGEPITGSAEALKSSLYGIGEGVGMVPVRIARHVRHREEHERRKRAKQKRRAERQRAAAEQPAETSPQVDDESLRPPPINRQLTKSTASSAMSADPTQPLPKEVIEDLNWGVKRAGIAMLTMPNDLAVAFAQGTHNAPRLWGDNTVRKPIKIHGVKSGLTAARKEFAYGIYDGWTGLVTLPKSEWQDGETLSSKWAGLGSGIGKGLGGFVFKNANALIAPPAFFVEGVIRHMEKKGKDPENKALIRGSRFQQGQNELQELLKGGEKGKKQLDKIRMQVTHGWSVYERLWATAQQTIGPVKGNLLGLYRTKREKESWDVNRALENVDFTKHGKDGGERLAEELLARHQKELEMEARSRRSMSRDEKRSKEQEKDTSSDESEDEDGGEEERQDSKEVANTMADGRRLEGVEMGKTLTGMMPGKEEHLPLRAVVSIA